jgi:hypothetical protein
MFEHHTTLFALRGVMVAVCLALLVGCLPRTTNPAAPVPSNLVATAGDAVVTLTWTASSGATGYNVKRATSSGGPYTQLAGSTSPEYSDSPVTNGTTYYYVVSALNVAGESANSGEASATPEAARAPPAAPINLTATAGDSMVTLTWTASSGAAGYYVKRSTTSGGPYTQIAAPTSTSYADASSLTNGTTYYYVVSAINSAGESANSAQASAVPSSPPPTTFGTWINVTPTGVDLDHTLTCGNFGATTLQADAAHPSNLYTEFNCQGIWKSTDYGLTWTGPINTGTNGAAVGDCSGGIALSPDSTAAVPTIYESCFRGSGAGFWKSVDGGVNWTRYFVAPSGTSRQDYFPPVVDPYDGNHLLMAGHEQDYVVESLDAGQSWSNVPIADGMKQNTGTGVASGAVLFINTGNAAVTRATWLWMGQQSGGIYGTWRTSNSGAAWVRVDKNEHGGAPQIYQPDNNGAVFMAGAYSALGQGVLRSNDYGQTWTHVGLGANEAVVFGTSHNVYAMYGYPVGPGGSNDPAFEVASQPGTGTWVAPGTPAGLTQGSAQIAVVNDGTHNVMVGAMYNSGVWRYVEP